MTTSPIPTAYSGLVSMVLPEMENAGNLIGYMPLSHRSTLIKCCQAQRAPVIHSPLYRMVKALPPFIFKTRNGAPWDRMTALQFSQSMSHYIENPVYAAFLLDLLRAAPLPPHEIEAARVASWHKEIRLCEQFKRVEHINWAPIFNPLEHGDEPVLPGVRPNPTMARAIHSSLLFWRRKQRGTILFPRSTRKNMSRDTSRSWERYMGRRRTDVVMFTQVDWLHTYHHYGIELEGAIEMRQKWYPSGAKPRTYYAQGGTHYAVSAHLQDVFTDLANCSPITNHVTRLMPTRLSLSIGEHYRIYDLTSFTSNMWEQKNFCRHLADFCMGVPVLKFDVRFGLLPCDLGELLHDYNELCNYSPAVSYERTDALWDKDLVSSHGTASALGVFGNLMTCTFGHGAVVAQCVTNEDEVNVAGDDAQIKETVENVHEINICICALGDYERSKTFRSDDDGCICLKRPLSEGVGSLELGILIVPPSLITTFHYLFNYEDPRYTFHDDVPSWRAKSIVGRDWMRYLRSVHRAAWKLSEPTLLFALSSFRKLTNILGIPHHGFLGLAGDPFFWPAVTEVEELETTDPLDSLIFRRYMGTAVIPVCGYEPFDGSWSQLNVGDSLRINKSRMAGMLEKLGYLEEVDRCEKVVDGVDGYKAIRHMLLDYSPRVYNMSVLRSIPPMFNL